MVDDSHPAATASGPGSGPVDDQLCPWCSAPLPAPDADQCPSCLARLVAPEGVAVPGVTEVDTKTLISGSSMPRAPRMSIGMLIGTGDAEVPVLSDAELSAVAHPDADVRREMLRLELSARLAVLEKQARAIEAERAGDGPPSPPGGSVSHAGGESPSAAESPAADEPPEADERTGAESSSAVAEPSAADEPPQADEPLEA